MGKKIWKSTMHGTEKLKEGLKRDLQKQNFSLRNILWNVLSGSFISWVFAELCFKMETLPWAHVSSEMNWKLTGIAKFYFTPWVFLSPSLNVLDFCSSGIYVILEQWMMAFIFHDRIDSLHLLMFFSVSSHSNLPHAL